MPEQDARLIRAKFNKFEAFERALGSLKSAGEQDYEAYGPINLEELAPLMPRKGSPIRGIATVAAIIGLALFFYMCIASSLIYDLIVYGKPSWSNVPFVIPGYEGTILFGAFGAFIAVLILARLFIQKPPPEYDVRFSGDLFGIVVSCGAERCAKIRELLQDAGAVEIDEPRQH